MSEKAVPRFEPKDASASPDEDDAIKSPDLAKDLTAEDQRKAFSQEREKKADSSVPKIELHETETVETRGDKPPAVAPPATIPKLVIDVNKIKPAVVPAPPVDGAPKPAVEVPKPAAEAPKPAAEAAKPAAEAAKPAAEAAKPPAEVLIAPEIAKLPKLKGDELSRAVYAQEQLIAMQDRFLEPDKPGDFKPQGALTLTPAEAVAIKEGLAQELKAGVWGPSCQNAFGRYAKWLDTQTIRNIKVLDGIGAELPPGCPIKLPADKYQRLITPQLFKSLASADELALDLVLTDKTKVPSNAHLDVMDASYDWFKQSSLKIDSAQLTDKENKLNKLITENKFPEGWKRNREGSDDQRQWVDSAESMVDLAVRMRNYITAMQSLYKLSKSDDFPVVLPPGSKITLEHKGTTKTFTDVEVANMASDYTLRTMLKEGNLVTLDLAFPKDLRQEAPQNREKIANMRDWLKTYGDKIDADALRLCQIKDKPLAPLMYGDVEVKHGSGRFEEKTGKFLGLTDKGRYKPIAGEELRDVNLVGCDFEVQKVDDAYIKSQPKELQAELETKKGQYRIAQTIQAEKAPWYAYQNFRRLGIQNVGEKMETGVEFVEANAFLPVKNGDKIQVVQAQNLQSFKNMQMGWYGAEKGVTAVMDVAMLAEVAIDGGAMIGSLRMASTGVAQKAVKLTASEMAWHGGKMVLKATAAGAGLFNNAGGRETAIGEMAHTYRMWYFPLDIASGFVPWKALRGGIQAAEAGAVNLSAAQKIHSIIHGGEIIKGEAALKGINFLKVPHTGAHWAFKGSEFIFVPMVTVDIAGHWDKAMNPHRRDSVADVRLLVGDGRGTQAAEKGYFDMNNSKIRAATEGVLDGYSKGLGTGRPADVQAKVNEIFKGTKDCLNPANKTDKEAVKKQISANLFFTTDQVRDLEKAHPSSPRSKEFRLSEEQLMDLQNPDKRKAFPQAIRELAESFIDARDKDVVAASRIALMYLNRNNDGGIADVVGKVEVNVPQYTRDFKKTTGGGKGGSSTTTEANVVGARTVTMEVTSAENGEAMRRALERSDAASSNIVVGDALLRLGGITNQGYGSVLQDVLKSTTATREQKLAALSDTYGARMASIIDATRYSEDPANAKPKTKEEAGRDKGRYFGTGSTSMMSALENTAKNDADPDVRAMSAAILYGLKEKNVERRALLLNGFNVLQQDLGGAKGRLAARIQDFLYEDMNVDLHPTDAAKADAVRPGKLNAALALAQMIPASDKDMHKDINEAIAGCLSSTRADIGLDVIKAMLPDRIGQLSKENPAAAEKFRADALKLVKVPKSFSEADFTADIIGKMEPLLRGGDAALKRQLSTQLQDLLRNGSLAASKDFGHVSIAALRGLAALNDQDALPIVRSHASLSDKLKVGDKDIDAKEKDPLIRAAAIKALERMQDPALRQIVGQCLETENDVTARSYLGEISHAKTLLEPGTAEYSKQFQDGLVQCHGALKGLNHVDFWTLEARKKWVAENFKLLDKQAFQNACNDAAKESHGSVWRFFSADSTQIKEELKAIAPVIKERVDDWNRLAKMAKGTGPDADRAKRVMLDIIPSSNALDAFETGTHAVQIDGTKLHKMVGNIDFRLAAARTMVACASPGADGNKVTTHVIQQALITPGLESRVRPVLLEGLRKLYTANESTAGTKEQIAIITAEALRIELSRTADQNEAFQKMLIDDIQKYEHRASYPILDAMGDSSRFPAIKKQCKEVLDRHRYSMDLIYDQANPNQTATPEVRANLVRDALAGKYNADEAVLEMYKAYKASPITNSADPGLIYLNQGMNEKSERLQMAAARIVLESKLPQDHSAVLKAQQTMIKLRDNGSQPRYKKEAGEALTRATRK